jgi:transcriptional regulator with XRE-family HTH domain
MNAHTTPTDRDNHARVGQRLAAARRAAGLSQTDVGHRLGVPQSRVAKLETGDRRLMYIEAFLYADLYGVSIEVFQPNLTDQGS